MGVDVVVLDAREVTVSVAFAVAVLDARADQVVLGDPVEVFDTVTEAVVVRLMPGVLVERVVLEMVALPLEVREGLLDKVCELLVVELLLLLADLLCEGLPLVVLDVLADPVMVFVASGVPVLTRVGGILFVCKVDGVRGAEAEEVLDEEALSVALSDAAAVYVIREVGVTSEVGRIDLVPVVVFVEVFDWVGD